VDKLQLQLQPVSGGETEKKRQVSSSLGRPKESSDGYIEGSTTAAGR